MMISDWLMVIVLIYAKGIPSGLTIPNRFFLFNQILWLFIVIKFPPRYSPGIFI